MLSCEERRAVRQATLESLAKAGWPARVDVVMDDGVGASRIERIHRTWRRVIQRAAQAETRCVLLLEDDVVFGRYFTHNLLSWRVVRDIPPGGALYASLYNPSRPFLVQRPAERYAVAHPGSLWGAQALVMTPNMARYIDLHWDRAPGNPDQRMPCIASRVTPIYLHVPSLVDHAPVPTTWGGIEHAACDFDPEWRALDDACQSVAYPVDDTAPVVGARLAE
jgi:hypothetical protein